MKFFVKILLSLIFIIILVIAGSLFVINMYATTDFAEQKINEYLLAATDSTYQVELGKFEFDLFARSFRMEEITIKNSSHSAYPDISGHIPFMLMNDIHLYKLIRKRGLHFNRFEISEPDLRIDLSNWTKADKETQDESFFIQGSEFFITSGALTLITSSG